MTVTALDYPQQLLIDATSQIEMTYRANPVAKEPWTVKWIERIPPESTLYDIGANVGSYALIAASRGIRCVAFEPGAANYARLVENISRNKLQEWILPMCVALAQSSGMMAFGYSSTEVGAAGHTNGSSAGQWQRMFALALDALTVSNIIPMPTHLKIDVDGAEVMVLAGAVQTLAQCQSVLLEIDRANVEKTAPLLAAAGLTLKDTYAYRNGKPIAGVIYEEWVR